MTFVQSAHRRSRIALDGLVIIIVALAVFAVAAALTTTTAAERAAAAVASGMDARSAVAALQSTERLVLMMTTVVAASGILLLVLARTLLARSEDAANRIMSAEMNRANHASLTDYVTGLGNHRAFQNDLLRNVAQLWNGGSVMTIALVDVDGLKDVNDRRGYATGDRLLSALGRVLRTADFQSVPYRLGGDEFALAFPGMTAAVARTRMEQVRSVVEDQLGGTTVSIGLATMSLAEPDLLMVCEQANAALDEAKLRGRNTVVSFDDIRDDHPMFQPARVAAVRRLISAGTIGVAFQPIWNMQDGTLIGYEALARPSGDDALDPQDAFSIAERIGKAHALDRICRVAILEQAKTLPAGVLLFLNVSPRSLDREDFDGAALVRTVQDAGLHPERVVLKITARSTAHIDVVIREAARLRRLGFRLALDDTGIGSSGLEILSQLVVDYVKIEGDVLVRALAGAGGRGIFAGIIAIAHEMRATIIAEGIENAEMLELVRGATSSSPAAAASPGYYLVRHERFVDTGRARPRFAATAAAS